MTGGLGCWLARADSEPDACAQRPVRRRHLVVPQRSAEVENGRRRQFVRPAGQRGAAPRNGKGESSATPPGYPGSITLTAASITRSSSHHLFRCPVHSQLPSFQRAQKPKRGDASGRALARHALYRPLRSRRAGAQRHICLCPMASDCAEPRACLT